MTTARPTTATERCPVCGESRPKTEMVHGELLRPAIQTLVRSEKPEWTPDQSVCLSDLHRLRRMHLASLLEAQRGDISELDRQVIDSIHRDELIARNVDAAITERTALGGRVADRVAAFGGSWTFIGIFAGTIVVWIAVNALLLAQRAWDPYPFILLNLVLSCLAAVQAPVIMMSQNRQDIKDRAHAEHDYQVNLKAELEIQLLHEKMDHLLLHQWQQLMEVQAIQAELLEELTDRTRT